MDGNHMGGEGGGDGEATSAVFMCIPHVDMADDKEPLKWTN